MTAVTVDSVQDAMAFVGSIQARLRDFRPVFSRIERSVLPDLQKTRWDRRFDMNLRHAASTIKKRAQRRQFAPGSPYYAGVPPNERARPDHPYFEWTGALRESTDRFTETTATHARIIPDRNYRGPVTGPRVFSSIVGSVVPEDRIWDQRALEQAMEREIENWIRDDVVRS